MELYCAIDLLSGRAARLVQGDFDRRRDFGDPVELARRYLQAGASRLHVVDLDAARTGEPVNRAMVFAIVREASRWGAVVQVGGGVRGLDEAEDLLRGGAERVVLGTAAQRNPGIVAELCKLHPGRVSVGLDHRRGGEDVAVSGWDQSSGTSLARALAALRDVPIAAVVVTSIERDGTLEGPDLDGLRSVLGSTDHPVIASGGVRSAEDLRSLAELQVGDRRLEGAIVGLALVDGRLEVEEAIAACGT